MRSYTAADINRMVGRGQALILECGCTLVFRGTVENPVMDCTPCLAHAGIVAQAAVSG